MSPEETRIRQDEREQCAIIAETAIGMNPLLADKRRLVDSIAGAIRARHDKT